MCEKVIDFYVPSPKKKSQVHKSVKKREIKKKKNERGVSNGI